MHDEGFRMENRLWRKEEGERRTKYKGYSLYDRGPLLEDGGLTIEGEE